MEISYIVNQFSCSALNTLD